MVWNVLNSCPVSISVNTVASSRTSRRFIQYDLYLPLSLIHHSISTILANVAHYYKPDHLFLEKNIRSIIGTIASGGVYYVMFSIVSHALEQHTTSDKIQETN